MNFAGNYALGFNLHAALGKNHAVKATGDDHPVPFNLAFDLGAFAENDRLLGNYAALDVAVNAERSGTREGALQGHALINKSSPLLAGGILRRARPLPMHSIPQNPLMSTLSARARKSTRGCNTVVESATDCEDRWNAAGRAAKDFIFYFIKRS